MSNVRLEIDDRGVATITLDRPERLNAINMAMRDELWEHLAACRDIPDVRVIVFRGEGRAFSAGADISEFGTAPSVMAARSARHDRDVWWGLLNHRCLTIACLHGFCFGAGLELPLCCDVRLAVEGATFALPEVTLGYIPSAGGTQTLPRIIPPGIAASMILTGMGPVDSMPDDTAKLFASAYAIYGGAVYPVVAALSAFVILLLLLMLGAMYLIARRFGDPASLFRVLRG